MRRMASFIIPAWFLAAAACAADRLIEEPDSPPPAGISLPVEVVDVYDGDTLTVRITFTQRVRLLNCWAEEIRTNDPAAKQRGLAARDYLRRLAPTGARAVLWVPAADVDRPADVLSFDRALGLVWVDGQSASLSAQMVAAGRAAARRPN